MQQLEWKCTTCNCHGSAEVHDIHYCNITMMQAVFADHRNRSGDSCNDYKSIRLQFSYGHKSQEAA